MQNRKKGPGRKPLTIGLYTPALQGLYIGEIVNHIRQLCHIKGYELVVIRTGGFGAFDADLQVQRLDGAIIIRNAVAPALVERLLAMRVACVAIAYDYFPYSVPLIALDNAQGVGLAMDYLLAQGRRRIAFVGDLSQYDLRKRYEAYGNLCDEYGLHHSEAYVFPVGDAVFSGGQLAARQFVERRCDADAVIFGASLTGIGFVQQLEQLSPGAVSNLETVCFDVNPLVPVLAPDMMVVDQNLQAIAYRGLNVLEAQIRREPVAAVTLVEPKLISDPDAREMGGAVMATCTDVSALQSSHYIKALLANCYEWPAQIGLGNLDQLMVLAPVFPGFVQSAVLLRHFTDSQSTHWVKHSRTFTLTGTQLIDAAEEVGVGRASEGLPDSVAVAASAAGGLCINLPISVDGQLWGWLVVLGTTPDLGTPSSYAAFAGFLEITVKLFEQDLALALQRGAPTAAPPASAACFDSSVDPLATIYWEVGSGVTHWSDQALTAVGFVSPIERNVYQHMEFTDRIHPADLDAVRQAVAACCALGKDVKSTVRFKLKNGHYVQLSLQGKALLENNRTRAIEFCIGVQPRVDQ